MSLMTSLRSWAANLKQQIGALYFACRDPETPRLTRWLAIIVVAYALSPIDLIPDFIPVIGYLDDLILLPLGCWLVIKSIPEPVWQRSLVKAQAHAKLPKSVWMGVLIIIVWLALAILFATWMIEFYQGHS